MEEVRTQPRLGDNCRIVTVTVNLVNAPRSQRAERLRTLCGWLAALSLIAAYGCVAWVEGGGDLLWGTIAAFVSIGLFALFTTLNGAMVW